MAAFANEDHLKGMDRVARLKTQAEERMRTTKANPTILWA